MTNRRYYAYARHALVTALKIARVQPGSEVLIPHFICRDVLAALAAVGARPSFYELDSDLQLSAEQSLPAATALLAVNYFGFPADLERIRTSISSANTVVIEDNAHGWLSSDHTGVLLGTRGPLGITSFRKTILSPDGAYLEWSADPRLDLDVVHTPLTSRKDHIGLGFRGRRFVQQMENATRFPIRQIVRDVIRATRRAQGKPSIIENASDEFHLPRDVAVHEYSLRQFNKVDQESEISRRRSLFIKCQELASHHEVCGVFSSLPTGVVPQGFPFYADSGNTPKFIRALRYQCWGEVMPWPALPAGSTLSSASRLRSIRLVNFL